MHAEAFRFVERALLRLPLRRRVVEFGGRDVNGSVRSLFPNDASYVNVDRVGGKGVDIIADASEFLPSELADTVVCCETLEHTEHAAALCANAAKVLERDGVFIVTAASGSRSPHSSDDGGAIRPGEWYQNIPPERLSCWLRDSGFAAWRIETHPRGDVYAIAWKVRESGDEVERVRLYAVVATLNGLSHTKVLEQALRESSVPLRLIVIDNGSVDGTRDWLKHLSASEQICIVNERNLGVAASWNLGIRIAAGNNADAVLVCGNDTQPFPGTIERLTAHIRRGCAFVTGTSVSYDAPICSVGLPEPGDPLIRTPDFGMFMMSLRTTEALATYEQGHGLKTGPYDAGLFDSRFYPAYFEDNDYAWRLGRAGIPTVRDPGALFRHDRSLAIRSSDPVRKHARQGFRANHALFLGKWGFSPRPSGRHPDERAVMSSGDGGAGTGEQVTVGEAALESVKAIGGPVEVSPGREGRGPVSVPLAVDSGIKQPGLRILWSSNAPWVASGYGVQTKLFAPRLSQLGHEVAIHGFFGLDGGPIGWEGLPVYPSSTQPSNQDIITAHADHFQADIVLYHCDAWVLDFHLLGADIRIVPWFPVDSDPIPPRVADRVRESWRGIAFSKFGQRKAAEVGLDVEYVPLGVDTSIYRPLDKSLARAECGMPGGAFIVGMVAMNKEDPSRKGFPQAFQAFAEFRSYHRDAMLYLHTQPRGIGGTLGVDLIALARALGIEDAVHFAPEYVTLMGARDSEMAVFYAAIDVLIAPSLGEGFCVPIVEAQACGRPVIVGGWTSMPELCFAGVQIPRDQADRRWTGLGSWQFIPRVGALVEALKEVHCQEGRKGFDEATARTGALAFDVNVVTERFWSPVLSRFRREIPTLPSIRSQRPKWTWGTAGSKEASFRDPTSKTTPAGT